VIRKHNGSNLIEDLTIRDFPGIVIVQMLGNEPRFDRIDNRTAANRVGSFFYGLDVQLDPIGAYFSIRVCCENQSSVDERGGVVHCQTSGNPGAGSRSFELALKDV
jgi:hypothetical protein